MNKEVRYSPIVFRNLEDNSRRLEGRAIVFGSYSNNLGFYEKINRSAISQELINNSDIIFTFNHDPNQLLARYRNGGGSLDVELREDGVYFSFDIPNTTLGNDIYELIKRGDISNCSFCFTVADEKDSQKWEKRDGKMYREIMKIDGLYDLSAVTYPAYSDTDINARSIEARNIAEKELDKILEEAEKMKEEQEQEKEQEIRSEEQVETEVEVEKPEEEKPEEEIRSEEKEAENTGEKEHEPEENPEEKTEDEKPDEISEKREINKENKNNHNIMNKQYSLVKELRNAIDNNEKSITVNAETRTMTVQGYGEGEGAVPGVHDEVVETEIQGILEPLYANSVLAKLGARFYTGLPKGDVQIPIMDSEKNVGWAGEIEAASAHGTTFSAKKLSPKRLTAYVDISKQLLAQDTIGVENAIRRDIVNALNDKLEKTILGDGAKTDEMPAGIFNGVSAFTRIGNYKNLCDFEATLDDANIGSNRKYLMGNTAKATLRSMIKGTNNSGFVLEAGQVDGTPMVNTSNVATKKFVYGDFSYLAIGSWGTIDITIDQYTQAVNGCVRLIVNSYWDAVILRPECFGYGDVA